MSGRIPLPDACPVGQHEPAILHRSGGASAKVVNRCGRCGREIERQTEQGGRNDPWMTQEQHEAEIRELRAEDGEEENPHIGYHQMMNDRCPPRE